MTHSQAKKSPIQIKHFKWIGILLGENMDWHILQMLFFPHSIPCMAIFEIIASKILTTLAIERKISKLCFISSPLAQLPNGPLIWYHTHWNK